MRKKSNDGITADTISTATVRLAIAGGVIFLLGATLISASSRYVSDAIFTEFAFSLTIVLWGYFLRYSIVRQRSGAILLDLGHNDRQPSWQIVLAALLGGFILFDYFTQGRVEIYQLVQGGFWLSAAAILALMRRRSIVIAEAGIYHVDDMVAWENIRTFEWDKTFSGNEVLILRFKRRKLWWNSIKFRVPAAQKSVVEQLLLQRVAG
jgi:hypothetical protein